MNRSQLTHKPLFWILFSFLSIAGLVFSYKYFSKALPLVNLDVKMDRTEALQQASLIAQQHNIGPKNFRQAIAFNSDKTTQIFIELEGGGKEAFTKMIQEKKHAPYTWQVRHFKESKKNEVTFVFTPEGNPYGFREKISENTTGEKLSVQKAQVIAEQVATKTWKTNLQNYKLIESSKNIPASGRIDHTFVYEKQNEKIGKGRYRLKLVVSGDKLTELIPFIKIPDDFRSRYQEMRSANKTIATASSVLMFLLYILGGCLIGLFFLLKYRFVLWKMPLIFGGILGLFHLASAFNNIPNAWMTYDTALPAKNFLLSYLLQSSIFALGFFMLSSFIIMIAESLTRKAFGNHIQLWKMWSKKAASSPEVLGRTLGGYLIVGLQLALVIGTYFFATRLLGWWSPSDVLINPNILSTYFPWLSSVTMALSAGFIEECLFRAVPIACAVLLGKKYGRTTLWVILAFVVQALVFGGAHANYATQPSYARLVELIIPSFIFGFMYFWYGLLPAIISHATFDLVLMSLPLFVASGTNMWGNQLIVIILGLTPLAIILFARLKAKAFTAIKNDVYNKAWQPPTITKKTVILIKKVFPQLKLNRTTKKVFLFGGIISLFIWGLATNFRQESPGLFVSRTEASTLADKELKKQNITLDQTWQALPVIIGSYALKPDEMIQHKFIWQSDKSLYRSLIGNYLTPARWVTRFVTFDGKVSKRSEEYQITIAGDGIITRLYHKLPELREGKNLKEQEARTVVHNHLIKNHSLKPQELKEISAIKIKKPNRTDWLFSFFNPTVYTLKEGQTRVNVLISGDKISDTSYRIHVPENWIREERKKQNAMNLIKLLSMLFLFLLFLLAIIKGNRAKFSIQAAVFAGIIFAILLGFLSFNNWPSLVAGFNTSEPFGHQLFTILVSMGLGILIQSGILALFVGLVYSYKPTTTIQKNFEHFLVGIGAGTFVAALGSLSKFLIPVTQPLWATFTSMGSQIPWVSTIIGAITGFVSYTIFAMIAVHAIATMEHKLKNGTKLLFPFFIICGLALTGIAGYATIVQWMLAGSIIGTIFFVLYHFAIKFNHAIVVPLCATHFALKYVQQAFFSAYPLAWLTNSITAITVICVALFLFVRTTKSELS